MELTASEGSSVKTGGDLAGESITKTITHNNDGGMEALILAKITAIETRLLVIEQYNQRQGVEDMISEKFFKLGGVGILLLLIAFPALSITRPSPTSASFVASPFNEYSGDETPSLQPPTVHKIKEWCLGEAYGVGENTELPESLRGAVVDIPCTLNQDEFRQWLTDAGAEDAPVLTYIINEGGTPEMTQNPILGVGFDCTSYNYGCSVLYFNTNSSNLNQNFVAAPLSSNWRNRISSYQKWLWHNAVHYDNGNLTGASITCSCSNMGAMDNATDSILFVN